MMEWGSYGVEKRETTDYTDEHRFKNGGAHSCMPRRRPLAKAGMPRREAEGIQSRSDDVK